LETQQAPVFNNYEMADNLNGEMNDIAGKVKNAILA